MSKAIAPHGGVLVDRVVTGADRAAALESAQGLKSLVINSRQVSDLELIAIGAVSPLTGFMNKADYEGTVHNMHLANGLPWSIPVVLPVTNEQASGLNGGEKIALTDETGVICAILTVGDVFSYDKQVEAQNVYRTTEEKHPGVAAVYAQGDILVGGDIEVVNLPAHDDFPKYYLTPAQSRAVFAEKNWATVVGFQTRNPIHRAHEYIIKCAMEIVDGLFLHPLVGATKGDDIPADVRMRCYEVLLEGYFPESRVCLGINPAAMRYAGPREAIFHALIRKNYGCSHFIVGRDHAGVGTYYGTYDAQKIFAEFDPKLIDITPLMFEHSFWCTTCEGMFSSKTCPHGPETRVSLSGTKVREMLTAGEIPPPEFTRPEVAKVLIESMKG